MSENKSSYTSIIIVVALVVAAVGLYLGKSSENGNEQADTPEPRPKQEQAKLVESKEPAFIKQGLVAYYPFNGNAKDESGNGNDGKVKGPESVGDRHGNKDSAFLFSAKGVIQLPNNLLDGAEEATISAWVFSEPNEVNGLVGAIIFAGDERVDFDPICARLNGGRGPYIQFTDCKNGGQNGENSAPQNVRASIQVTPMKWAFFTMSLSANEGMSVVEIYIDGNKVFSGQAGNGFERISYDKPMPVYVGGILGPSLGGYQ